MKRQRGRNRGGGGGGKPQHNANRSFDSNGPEGIKVRGAAQGVFEKYTQLARDAASAGDRVLAENYLQHAEHYFRTVRAMQPTRPPSEILGREGSTNFDIDFEAEPDENAVETNEPTEGASDGEGGGDQQQRDRNFDNNNGGRRDGGYQDRPRFENRDRQDRGEGQGSGQGQGQGRRDRWRDRDDRPRDDRPREARDDRPREDRPQSDRPRDDRPRDDRPRDDRPREDRPERTFDRDDRPRRERFDRDREPRETPVAAEAPAPVADEAPSRRLRGQDGAVSEAPAFLSRGPSVAPAAAPASDEADAPKPRARRPRKIVASEGDI
jgi:hypothetical protein